MEPSGILDRRRVADRAPPLVLVTGGTGALGPVLVQRLLREPYRVRLLSRQAANSTVIPSTVEWVRGSIVDTNVLREATADVDVVFHLAAKLHILEQQERWRDEYEQINVEGTRRLLQAAQLSGVRRVVFFSTISVYGPTSPGEFSDESSPLHPDSFYSQTKAEAERICLQACQTGSAEPLVVVLRLAAVYGPRVKGNYARLLRALKRGWFIPVGPGLNRRTLVFDQDVVAAALLAAQYPQAAGQVFNVTDGTVHQFRDIIAAIALALNKRPPRLQLPLRGARALARAAEISLRLFGHRSPLTVAAVDKLVEDVAVKSDKIQRTLGFQPAFDLDRGWRATLTGLASDESACDIKSHQKP